MATPRRRSSRLMRSNATPVSTRKQTAPGAKEHLKTFPFAYKISTGNVVDREEY